MAKSMGSILLLIFVLSFVRADEHERWNTPPELTPESVKMLNNEEPQARLFSFNPTATVSSNAGNNNAHSVSLGASLDGISLSESNSYNHPTGIDGSSVSVSKSATISAGLSGISTASAEARRTGNNAKTESHSFSLGQATATSFGTIGDGRQAITGAASSAGTSQSSATGGNRRQFSQAGAANARYPYWPTWSNIGPSDDQRFNRPTLTVSKPCDETRPTLNINAPGAFREQKPTIHIYKWRPNHRASRPGISIEHQLHDFRNGRTQGSTSLRVESKDSEYSDSDLISDLAQTVGELFDIV